MSADWIRCNSAVFYFSLLQWNIGKLIYGIIALIFLLIIDQQLYFKHHNYLFVKIVQSLLALARKDIRFVNTFSTFKSQTLLEGVGLHIFTRAHIISFFVFQPGQLQTKTCKAAVLADGGNFAVNSSLLIVICIFYKLIYQALDILTGWQSVIIIQSVVIF